MADAGDADDGFVVSILVNADPVRAFEAFTEETDLWWMRGPRYRFRRPYDGGLLRFEPGPGGHLTEYYPDGSSFTVGTVRDWRPGERVHLTWRLPNFAADEHTEVIVDFVPERGATRVSVEHRGWSALRGDHPAFHGMERRHTARIRDAWWAEVLTFLRDHLRGDTA